MLIWCLYDAPGDYFDTLFWCYLIFSWCYFENEWEDPIKKKPVCDRVQVATKSHRASDNDNEQKKKKKKKAKMQDEGGEQGEHTKKEEKRGNELKTERELFCAIGW